MESGQEFTSELAKRFGEAVLAHARELFDRDGRLLPVFFILATRNPQTKERFDEPSILLAFPQSFDGEDDKDATATLVRETARESDALAVMFVAEAWAVMYDKMSEAEAKARCERLPPSDDPNRIEIVQAVLDHSYGTMHWRAQILREPDKPPTLAEFQMLPSEGTIQGRFASLLPIPGSDETN